MMFRNDGALFINFFFLIKETFCILFPPQYLDHVSCIVSLCGKTKTGKYISESFNATLRN